MLKGTTNAREMKEIKRKLSSTARYAAKGRQLNILKIFYINFIAFKIFAKYNITLNYPVPLLLPCILF